ncbi:MAG: hypothetical protein Q4E75_00585 [bacterium]|nr:hypothetical protein [bacterium]
MFRNNKGQVLVIFIIVLPIIILLMSYIYDVGMISIDKKSLDSTVKDATIYYLNNIDDPDVLKNTEKLINKNISDGMIDIKKFDKYISITVEKEYKSLFFKIINNKYKVTYKGIKENKKIIKGD